MKARFNAKYAIFSVVAIMLVYVLFHNERFVVQPDHPVWQHYEPFKWWLLPHAIAGSFVILLAPLQFSDRLRKRFAGLHRILGRLYVVGAFILAPLGAYIQFVEERQGFPRSFTVLAVINAVMLFGTTLIALVFAIKRRITQHRQWMIRSYAVALVFVEVRFILGVTGWETLGIEIVQAVIWSCLAMSLLFADVINHWLEIRATVAAPVKSSVLMKQEVFSGTAEPV
ncbi:MAG TPA: DUF2306 domain-containing protein [Blastocatellia bacterium]|nr:DUF2306 domain-containing protein [Blastocatellia bacterium]